VDECSAGDDDCDDEPNACINTSGGYDCACPSGYVGSGRGASGCADIDECAAGTDDCDDSPSACQNTAGGFRCVCPSGYRGDGHGANGCTDINECDARTDNCDDEPNACRNTTGSFECACPSGYSGNGQGSDGCRDVDECRQDSDGCDADPEACRNTTGSYECTCPAGFEGSGRGDTGCEDVDECLTDNGGCHAKRQCLNRIGTVECGSCEPGWGTSGKQECEECACYATGGAQACRSGTDSLPRSAMSAQGTTEVQSGNLIGYQIDLPDRAHIRAFVARSPSGSGPAIRMALYRDAGGAPGARVATSDATGFTGNEANGRATPASRDEECLTAGKYWIVAVASGKLVLGQANDSVPAVLLPAASGSDVPSPWPGGGNRSGSTLSMWVEIDRP
jgi:hypothetical protein